MSSSHGAPQSNVLGGWKPKRLEGRPEFKPGERPVSYAFIAELDKDDLEGLRVYGDDEKSRAGNHGPETCWGTWKSSDPLGVPFFSTHFPAVVAAAGRGTTPPGMLPMYARDMPDDRQEAKRPRASVTLPHGAIRFHTGQTGSVTAATFEEEQIDLFGADWMGVLLSASAPGADLSLSAYVYDAGPNGGPHPTRYAPLHRFAAAIDATWGSSVALNLTIGPGGDPTTTALPLLDHTTSTIGLGSFLFGAGPLVTSQIAPGSPACSSHVHGVDDLGRPIHAAHLAAGDGLGCLWLDELGRDAPLKFDLGAWRPLASTEDAAAAFGDPRFKARVASVNGQDVFAASRALWAETFLRYDGESSHTYQRPDGTWASAPGKWRWQTPVPFATLSAPGSNFSQPETWEGTRTRTPSGGSTGPTGTGGGPGAGGGVGSSRSRRARWRKPRAEDYQNAERERQRRRRQGGGGGKWPPPVPQPPQWPPGPGPGGGPKGGKKPKNGGKPDPQDDAEKAAEEVIREAEQEAERLGDDRITIYDESQLSPPIPVTTGASLETALTGALLDALRTQPTTGDQTQPEGEEAVQIGPLLGNSRSQPELTFTETCLQVPNVGFVAYPTDEKAIAIGGGGVGREELLEAFTTSPLAAYAQALGKGDGSTRGQTATTNGDGWQHSTESALSFLPSAAPFRDYVGGEYDPCRRDLAAPSVVRVCFPAKLATIDFAHARQDPSQVTGCGGRIRQLDDGSGLTIIDLTSTGGEGSSAIEVTSSGVEITGSLTNNGLPIGSAAGNNAIGGSGEDGSVTYSSDTSIGAAVNASSINVQSGNTIYPGLSKPLALKATGTFTLSGAIHCAQRAYLEPS